MYSFICLGGLLFVILIGVVVTIYFIFLRPNQRLYPPLPPPPLSPMPPSHMVLNQIPTETQDEVKFDHCVNCGKKIPSEFNICPYCETNEPFKA